MFEMFVRPRFRHATHIDEIYGFFAPILETLPTDNDPNIALLEMRDSLRIHAVPREKFRIVCINLEEAQNFPERSNGLERDAVAVFDHPDALVWWDHLLALDAALPDRRFGQYLHPPGWFHFNTFPELFSGKIQAEREARQDRHAEIPLARLDVAQRFPVDIRHFSQSLLSQVSGASGLADVLSDQEQYLGVCHP